MWARPLCPPHSITARLPSSPAMTPTKVTSDSAQDCQIQWTCVSLISPDLSEMLFKLTTPYSLKLFLLGLSSP